jgi:hypothetical protein
MTQFDFAKLPPQFDRRMALQTLMQSPQDTVVTYAGKQMMVSDALGRMMKGDGAAIVPAPAPAQPGAPTGLTISQRAVDALTAEQYKELEATGHLQGLTNSDNGRAIVHVRDSSGTVTSRFSFNVETGAIEPGRLMDLRDFDAPAE